MAEPRAQILNPILALTRLYQKDGRSFKDVVADLTEKLTEFGVSLQEPYLTEKVLPWVYSLMLLAISEIALNEYIASLTQISRKPSVPPGTPNPKPEEVK